MSNKLHIQGEYPPDFADLCADAIIQAKAAATARGDRMYRSDLVRIIRAMDAERLCAEPNGKKTRPRNLLLDTLVTLNGEKLEEVSPVMFRQAVAALRDIRSVCPEVTPMELKRRFANLRAQMPNATTLSSTCLAKWWATADRAGPISAGEIAQVRM